MASSSSCLTQFLYKWRKHVISALQNEENVNDNYLISILVHKTACQRLEGQKTSAIKCNSFTEKGGDL